MLADTLQGGSGGPTRVMALIIRTADGRMYELRVDMPKGTPDEKRGRRCSRAPVTGSPLRESDSMAIPG
ncbi:hypothetical protein N7U49_29385 [Streptomyces sp. AD2-2]|nr:hypothetical protein N7U49_29385 [Streptomyces sp. AD2-2]